MITSINNENNLNLGKHCGEKSGQSVIVTGDYAVLTFHTDENVERKGFLLTFSATPKGMLNLQKTDQDRGKELPRKENPGRELTDGDACCTFKGLKCDFVTRCDSFCHALWCSATKVLSGRF